MTFRRSAGIVAALAVLSLPLSAQAHRQWMVPSSTVLSGADAWVTVDAAVSNTLFFPDHVPMRLNTVAIVGPDGASVPVENGSTGKYRSTFDVHLTTPGTYKIVSVSDMLGASYTLGGETKRWRGTQAELAAAIPKDATDVKVMQNQRRLETFVSLGKPTAGALKPTGKGLELELITNPNDLAVSEPARFRLLLDGKPAPGVDVTVLPGAARYRADTGQLSLKTGADGVVAIKWPAAGMYWMEATVRGGKTETGAERSSGYVATFEVLPD